MYTHHFSAMVQKYDYEKYYYTVVYIPDYISAKLDMAQHMRLRVEVEIDGYPTKGTLMPDRIGSKQTRDLLNEGYRQDKRVWYYQIPRRILNSIGKTFGDEVTVALQVGDQDEVEMHPDQEEFLLQRPDLKEIWDGLTPGKRRSLSYPIVKAKSDVTLEKRLAELEDFLLNIE
jgi:hypothetical protein